MLYTWLIREAALSKLLVQIAHIQMTFLRRLCWLVYCLLSCLVLVGVASVGASQQRVTLMVDTRALSLSVVQGEEVVTVFDNIAIGSNGATWNKRQGDEKTPLGDFRITEVRQSDRFVMFIALDYPTLDHAQRALQDKRISSDTFDAVKSAFAQGRPPPQQTSLGGHIGIHGLGSGDPEVHSSFNWTNGCIAVTNEQLEKLLLWIGPGTRVLIR